MGQAHVQDYVRFVVDLSKFLVDVQSAKTEFTYVCERRARERMNGKGQVDLDVFSAEFLIFTKR